VKNIEILYEDDNIIVVNKPAGLAVQGGEGVKTSLDKIFAELRTPKPLLVHRLDKDTSGVLLAAKGRENAARFSRLLNSPKITKQYTAICAGRPKNEKGVITDKLLIHGNLKSSETRYKVLKTSVFTEENLEYSALELELGTGRMHQIRRHLAMNGNPVLGDDKYGDFTLNKKLHKSAGLKRLLLHASRLIIKESFNLDIRAPLPDYFSWFYEQSIDDN
jgi:23S rRNA pseudouridine955/2504/2580 synthase